ncbi:MAG TPA: glycosyltransferase family 87 protein, partial [Thermoguttaceae bacterium]|nr:glycosyltransferase family 87 protein [Thermoguttaceae bacterium]
MSGPNYFGFSKGAKRIPPFDEEGMAGMALGLTRESAENPQNTQPFSGEGVEKKSGWLPGPRWVWWTAAVAVVVGWGLADIRLRGLPWPERPLEHKTDFTVYTAAGRAFFTGQNPYEVTNPRGWKYLYPPLFALLVAPLNLLPMPEQCLVWYFISVAFCWGCYRELARIVAGFRIEESRLAKIPLY